MAGTPNQLLLAMYAHTISSRDQACLKTTVNIVVQTVILLGGKFPKEGQIFLGKIGNFQWGWGIPVTLGLSY